MSNKKEDTMKKPKISRRQVALHWIVTSLADGGRKNLDEDEPSKNVWYGIKNKLFHLFRRVQWKEAKRLRAKYGNTTYGKRRGLL